MTPEELARKWRRREEEAVAIPCMVSMDRVCAAVVEDLKTLTGVESVDRLMDTAEAGTLLRKARVTIRRWCKEGQFPGARKTNGGTGEWMIPSQAVFDFARGGGVEEQKPRRAEIAKLWSGPKADREDIPRSPLGWSRGKGLRC